MTTEDFEKYESLIDWMENRSGKNLQTTISILRGKLDKLDNEPKPAMEADGNTGFNVVLQMIEYGDVTSLYALQQELCYRISGKPKQNMLDNWTRG